MKNRKHKFIGPIFSSTFSVTGTTLALLVSAGLSSLKAEAGNDNRAPVVPDAIEVPGDTNKVCFHVYAVGWQVYTNDSITFAWGLNAPEAMLFDAEGNLVGIHYAYG